METEDRSRRDAAAAAGVPLHVVGNGDPITRIGFTLMRAMGVPIERWGTKSLQTSKPITEILA